MQLMSNSAFKTKYFVIRVNDTFFLNEFKIFCLSIFPNVIKIKVCVLCIFMRIMHQNHYVR